MRNDRRRERRLAQTLSKEGMARWSKAQREIERLKDKLEEVQNDLDDPKTPPAVAAARQEQRDAIEERIEELRIDQYWEEHGGIPCAEIDCCDPKYAKCRPPCPPSRPICVCVRPADCPDPPDSRDDPDPKKPGDEGKKDPKRVTTQGGSAGKHAGEAKAAQPEGIEPDGGGDVAGDSEPSRGHPDDVETPDYGVDDADEQTESPDDGRLDQLLDEFRREKSRKSKEKGDHAASGPPPLVFAKGNVAHNIFQGTDGSWYIVWSDGNVFRLKSPPREIGKDADGKAVYDLDGVERQAEPVGSLAKVLNLVAGAVQDFLGDNLELAKKIVRQYENEAVRQVIEQFAVEGKVDPGAVVWLAAVWVAGAFGHIKLGKLSPSAQTIKKQLRRRGVKFDTDLVDAFKARDGRLLFYEARDLTHQIEKHAHEFAKVGIAPDKIHRVTRAALETGTFLGRRRTTDTLYEVYEVAFEGRNLLLQVKVNPNGAVGGGNLISSLVDVIR